jgi:hypothetical protein
MAKDERLEPIRARRFTKGKHLTAEDAEKPCGGRGERQRQERLEPLRMRRITKGENAFNR